MRLDRNIKKARWERAVDRAFEVFLMLVTLGAIAGFYRACEIGDLF